MSGKITANQRNSVRRVSVEVVERLNRIDPGLGTALANEINHDRMVTNTRFQAAAGQRGTVTIAPQKREGTGVRPAAIDVKGGQIVGGTWTTQGDAFVTLDQLRSMFTCDHFGGHPSGFPGWFEECVDAERMIGEAGATAGNVHAMYGVTYEIPPDADTASADCGLLEFGVGFFWQYIVPVQTTVDQVTWRRTLNTDTNVVNGVAHLRFALYDCNQEADSYPIVAKTDPQDLLLTAANTTYTLPLDSRITIDPGVYALAMTAPCFHSMAAINNNNTAFLLVNEAYEDILPDLAPAPRYGAFTSTGAMPDQLDATNIVTDGSFDATSIQAVPLVYFADTQEFA